MTIDQDGFGQRNWRSVWDTMVCIVLTDVTLELKYLASKLLFLKTTSLSNK